jgi:hypothetical protein
MLYVELGRLGCVMRRVVQMSLRRVSMVRGGFVIARFVVLRGLAMVMGRVFVVLSRFLMMLRCLFGHESSVGISSE